MSTPLPRKMPGLPANRAISPPPVRKRKRSPDLSAAHQTAAVTIRPTVTPLLVKSFFRVFSWNINGIAPFIQPTIASFFSKKITPNTGTDTEERRVNSLRDFLRHNEWPQILNLQEVKINPSDEATKHAVEKAVNRDVNFVDNGPQYTVRFCLPRDKYNARGFGRKVYGVCSIMRNDFFEDEVTAVREVDWDVEGRILVIETRSKCSIWNIYAVNGTDNAYRDPSTGQVVGNRHDRKLAFHRLMLEECRRLEAAGWRLILSGDLNISPQPIDGFPHLRTNPEQHVRNRTDYNDKFLNAHNADGLRAIDTFRYLHPYQRGYTWISTTRPWLSSCDRVDHILVSRSFVDADQSSDGEAALATAQPSVKDITVPSVSLVEAEILMTETDRASSDHVPIYVTIRMDR